MLRAEGLQKRIGARVLFDGVDLEIRAGDRVGLVGRNGEGKTTLLRILSGQDVPDDGRIHTQRGARVGYLRQEIDPTSERSVLAEAETALADLQRLERELSELQAELARQDGEIPAALGERYDRLERSFHLRGGFEADARVRATLSGLGLGPDRWDVPLRSLSGGWLMRVELAKLLLVQPEVLLLDEPTNHLDIPAIAWFEKTLEQYPGGVVVVSHDRAFLDRHVNRIAALEHGRIAVCTGNYAAYETYRDRDAEQREAQLRALDRRIAHAQSFVDRFGAKASHARQAQSRVKQIEKLNEERAALAPPQKRRALRFEFPETVRSGDLVLRLEDLSFGYPEQALLYRELSLELRRGERVALVGANGAGKSTLLRLAAGELEPAAGSRALGHGVRLGYFAQHQLEALDPQRTVLQELEADAPLEWVPRLRGLLGLFLFSGDDVDKKIAVLSGGERARVALAKLFLQGANFLILDEPTNHLDIGAREMLSDALARFPGTLAFISHDRHFIDALATRVLLVAQGSDRTRIESHPGNFSDFERRTGAAAPGVPPEPAAAGAQRAAEAPAKPRGKGKPLSPNARRKLERECREAEESIASLEQDLQELDALFADPAVARDGERVRGLRRERALLENELRERYARWEELDGTLSES